MIPVVMIPVMVLGLGGCQAEDRPLPPAVGTSQSPARPPAEPDAHFTIVAGGDVLPHMPVLTSARTADGYDFTPLLAGLDPWVSGADLALCHMEIPVAPPGSQPSGYPVFGTVPEVVRDLAEQGWDGCSTASNHAVDRGQAGLDATIDAFDAAGLGHVGTARSEAEDTPALYRLERAGRTFTVAHLAVTYGTNGMPVAHPWSVDLVDVDAVVARATQARTDGADLVLVSVHCCTEYVTAPTAQQVDVATALADSGVVDLVIGHHAHVPQPVELLPGGPDGQGMWVAYGLGNYVSNQDAACCAAATSNGQLLVVQVTATGADPAAGAEAGPPRVTSAAYLPNTVDRLGRHLVYALPAIPDGTSHLSASEVATRLSQVVSAAGPQAPVATTPPTPTGDPPVVVKR
jgi:poly-gamma-glutamate synthesis protein (capsule biosynthesis protein)